MLSQWRRRLQLQCLNFMREVKLLLRVPRVVKSPFPPYDSSSVLLRATFVLPTPPVFMGDLLLDWCCWRSFRLGPNDYFNLFRSHLPLPFHFLSVFSFLSQFFSRSAPIPLTICPHLRIKILLSNLVETVKTNCINVIFT